LRKKRKIRGRKILCRKGEAGLGVFKKRSTEEEGGEVAVKKLVRHPRGNGVGWTLGAKKLRKFYLGEEQKKSLKKSLSLWGKRPSEGIIRESPS